MNKSTEYVPFPSDKYLTNLQNFGEHLKSTVSDMLDHIDAGGNYEDKYNLQITCNGKTVDVELHADAYSRMMGMLETEMSEYIELKGWDKHEES